MKVQEYNFNIYQGSTLNLVLRLSDIESGEPLDYTGFTARGMIRVRYTDPTPAGEFTCVFTDAANGVLSVSMSSVETGALDFKTAFYDIEIVAPGGSVRQVLRGKVTLFMEATK